MSKTYLATTSMALIIPHAESEDDAMRQASYLLPEMKIYGAHRIFPENPCIFFTTDEAGKTLESWYGVKPFEVNATLPYHRVHCFNTALATLNTWTSVLDMLDIPF